MTQDIQNHKLVPTHVKLTEEERKVLLEKNNILSRQLPKILRSDPSIAHLAAKGGDVIKVTRESPTAGVAFYYRVVIDE